MNAFSRLLVRRSRFRRVRIALVLAAAFAAPVLATSVSLAAGEPELLNKETIDADGNGRIDRIRLVFNLAMNQSLVPEKSDGAGDPGVRVSDGYQVSGFAWGADARTLDVLLAEKTTPDTAATPRLIYEEGGNIESLLQGELASGTYDIDDGAGPALVSFSARDLGSAGLFNTNAETVWITFSERATLAGQTKIDRWSNLEKLIRFQPVAPENLCPVDGDGGPNNFNFPQPNATLPGSADAIDSPAPGGDDATYVVSRKGSSIQSNYKIFPGIPTGCKVSIDPDPLRRAVLMDAAQNMPAATETHKVWIQPVDVRLLQAETQDLRGPQGEQPDGILDAVKLTFEQALDTESIDQSFSVRLGGVSAAVTSIETVADPKALLLRFTPPNTAAWHSGATPQVSYTKPASCSATGGDGLKALLAGTWRACIATFANHATVDAAGPVLTDSVTADLDADGDVDRVRLTFNEPIAAIQGVSGWTIDGQAATAAADVADAHFVNLAVPAGLEIGSGTRPAIAYARVPQGPGQAVGTQDAAGVQVVNVSRVVHRDGAAPAIVGVVERANGQGNVHRAILTYSEVIVDPSSVGGFTVGGTQATLVAPAGDDAADDATLTLAVSGLSGSDAKEVAYAPGAAIRDVAGNAAVGQTVAAAAVVDEAAPVASIDVEPNAPIPAGDATIVVTYTEEMDTSVAPTVTFTTEQGPKNVTAVGWSEDGRVWEGTVSIDPETDCTVSTGCPVTVAADGAQDLAAPANVQAPASLQTMIDTVAPAAPTAGSFTAVLRSGEQAPANTVNMFTRDLALSAGINAGEATGGVARLLLDDGLAETEPVEIAVDDAIGASDTTVAPTTSYGSVAALQAAIAEGSYTLTVELCDAALNCAPPSGSVGITVDYTPDIEITLTAPANRKVVRGGGSLDVTWDGADGVGFSHVDVAYSTDGGQSFPNGVAAGLPDRDGTFPWSVPEIDDDDVVVRASASDAQGNKTYAPSDPFEIRTKALFADVPAGDKYRWWVEGLYDSGVTTGCANGPMRYCPDREVDRAQMAVFLLRAMGQDGDLPTYQGYFSDVPEGWKYTPYIEKFFELGITTGCGGGKFCPGRAVDRQGMAVFMVRALGLESEVGEPQGMFADMKLGSTYTPYVEKFYEVGVTTGCGTDPLRYCPDRTVDRAGMAVFVVRAWSFPTLAP